MTSKAFATRAFPLINDSTINGDLLPGLFQQTEITSFFSFGLVGFLALGYPDIQGGW